MLSSQEGDPLNKAATSIAVPQPCVIVRGTLENISTALVVERKLDCKIPPNKAVIALLSGTFYVYNIEYKTAWMMQHI